MISNVQRTFKPRTNRPVLVLHPAVTVTLSRRPGCPGAGRSGRPSRRRGHRGRRVGRRRRGLLPAADELVAELEHIVVVLGGLDDFRTGRQRRPAGPRVGVGLFEVLARARSPGVLHGVAWFRSVIGFWLG